MQAYVICTAPRSGSTLLCRMLAATGVAGRPASLAGGVDVVGIGIRDVQAGMGHRVRVATVDH